MSRRKKILIAAGMVILLGAIVFANLNFTRESGAEVNVEKLQKRDLEAIVSASGTLQPKRSVNISADTMGRVTSLAVNEGDRVQAGQLLLQIDPRNLTSAVQRSEAGLEGARSAVAQSRTAVDNTRVALKQAQDNLARQRELAKEGLITREVLERAESEVSMREGDLRAQLQAVSAAESRLRQEQATLSGARLDLSKVRIESPITGLVTRRNIEEGEMVVIGTMNNAGTVLLTIADMSVIEAEVEVDETDIPDVAIGQVAKISVDAFPDRTYTGRVTEVGNSPIQSAGASVGARAATNFKVVVQLEGDMPDIRPGFTCTAEITTATRTQVVGVPIQATTVREMIVDEQGGIVRTAPPAGGERRPRRPAAAQADEQLPPGQTRKELEGVFLVQNGIAVFTAVKTGIAGERFFEVVTGLKEGDEVIVGPFSSVRALKDGDPVKVTAAPGRPGSR
ncbi:MAG TPA: efflux RND transporter periplasmic adaptor subunit [Vicinamibacterales bacterium]|nr:efflux RND transporter periplasmic adaptor subunit [Vicinamibacterales bacterium]